MTIESHKTGSTYDKNIIALSANSFFAFISSFLFLFVSSQFITYLTAKLYSIPVELHYFNLIFPISDSSNLWTQGSIISIYSFAPIFCLLVSIFIRRYLAVSLNNLSRTSILFLTWCHIHGLNFFFGGLIIGIPLLKGFGFVPVWLYYSGFSLVLIIAVSGITLLLNGFYLQKIFTALTYSKICLRKPFVFILMVVYFPYAIGLLLFFILKFPDNSAYYKGLLLTILVQLVLIRIKRYTYTSEEMENPRIKVSKMIIFLTLSFLMLLVLLRLIIK